MNRTIVREKILEVKSERNFTYFQSYFKDQPEGVKLLIEVITKNEQYPIKEYSSWIIVHLCKSQPEQIAPFYKKIVTILFKSSN